MKNTRHLPLLLAFCLILPGATAPAQPIIVNSGTGGVGLTLPAGKWIIKQVDGESNTPEKQKKSVTPVAPARLDCERAEVKSCFDPIVNKGIQRVYYAEFASSQLSPTAGKVAFSRPYDSYGKALTCDSTYVTQVPARNHSNGNDPAYIKLKPGIYLFCALIWNDDAHNTGMNGRKAAAFLKNGPVYTKLSEVEQYEGSQISFYRTQYDTTLNIVTASSADWVPTADSQLSLYGEQTAGEVYSGGWKASLEIFRVGDLAK